MSLFKKCPDDFHRAVVMKLQSTICTTGDYVFYEGESGERMYFIKWGVLQARNATVISTEQGAKLSPGKLLFAYSFNAHAQLEEETRRLRAVN